MDFGGPSRRGFRQFLTRRPTLDTVEASPAIYRPRARRRPISALARALGRLLRGKYLELVLITIAVSVATSLRLTYLASPKFAIDYVLMDKPGPRGIPRWLGLPQDRAQLLLILGAAVLLSEILALCLDIWGRYRFRLLTWHVQIRFSRQVLDGALRLPLWKLQGMKSGGVTSLLREDARSPADVLFVVVVNLWRSALQLGGTVLVLATVDVWLLFSAVALLPVIWVTHRGMVGRVQPMFRMARRSRQEVDAGVAEAVAGIRTIRAFRRERSVLHRYVGGTHLMVRHMMRAWWRTTYVEIGWRIAVAVASVTVLIYGGSRVLSGRLTLGDLLMFLGYVAMLLHPLQQLVSGALRLQDDFAGFNRSLDVVEDEPESETGDPGRSLDRDSVSGHVRLVNVHYAYPDSDREVLNGLDIELRPGETVALVGPRGAGKTTAVNLLARFVEPAAGRVLLDGVDTRELSVASYRQLIGLVDQDVLLFDGTVRENIAFGDRHARDSDIELAAEQAKALEFISQLPDGFDTLVGERGIRLSGGQRQSIALARALLRKPKILILDEATNHLDGESEALILRSIQSLGSSCARLLVSHRLSTIRVADRVVMIESGRVVAEGTHAELLSRSSRYAAFLQNQLLASELEPIAARAASS
jgi:ATP-binding cassette subfamily B protein